VVTIRVSALKRFDHSGREIWLLAPREASMKPNVGWVNCCNLS
jgi:hypothetical protein